MVLDKDIRDDAFGCRTSVDTLDISFGYLDGNTSIGKGVPEN
jgi:hypothetical protein